MLTKSLIGTGKKKLVVSAAICGLQLWLFSSAASAFESLGIGTDALIGGDLTDPEDDGDPEFDEGYDAIFDANHEPGFGSENQDPDSAGAGESAFNVFDNILGPGNDKWCCGIPGGIFEDEPIWVSAQLPVPHLLTSFTVSSANDAPNRDPIFWAVQGSNDGENYTDIYVYEDDFGPWEERFEVIEFKAGDDFPEQTVGYEYFRFATYDTINNQIGDAAYFQIGEIEYFGTPGGDGGLLGDYNGDGSLDVLDLNLQADSIASGNNDLAFDETNDAVVNFDDRFLWVKQYKQTWIGDANLDGEFNSSDFVAVFEAGKFEQAVDATWAEGDWDGDKRFGSGDFVAAFQDGGFEMGPIAAVATVPEPSSLLLAMLSVFSLVGLNRGRTRFTA